MTANPVLDPVLIADLAKAANDTVADAVADGATLDAAEAAAVDFCMAAAAMFDALPVPC